MKKPKPLKTKSLQPVNNGSNSGSVLVTQTTLSKWHAPMPPPAILHDYDRIVPGAAERIMQMAEREQAHRIDVESRSLTANNSNVRRGQWLGAGISGAALVLATTVALMGGPAAVSIALVGVPVATIIRAIMGRTSPKPK